MQVEIDARHRTARPRTHRELLRTKPLLSMTEADMAVVRPAADVLLRAWCCRRHSEMEALLQEA